MPLTGVGKKNWAAGSPREVRSVKGVVLELGTGGTRLTGWGSVNILSAWNTFFLMGMAYAVDGRWQKKLGSGISLNVEERKGAWCWSWAPVAPG
jgi:hypothetical protein